MTFKKMDMQSRLQRKKQDSAMKLRKIDKTANRILDRKLGDMETTFEKEARVRFKEYKKLQYELAESDRENDGVLHLPHLLQMSPDLSPDEFEEDMNTPRSARGSPFHRAGTSSACKNCCSCRFHCSPRRHRCVFFPCSIPSTYHSIGYNIHPPPKSVLEDYGFEVFRNSDGVPISKISGQDVGDDEDVEDDAQRKSPRCTVKERLRGLRQLVKEMKERNERNRPRDWAVNYGQPVSRRQLLNPVIPV
ncbi:uncharacterized protein LOC121372361 isoform X3 [Gigantopelta aegis]|uniref:uncharacterized protein LOC121372361 isoform X2 n=1 Tax=Gigantopelta aegis TaxID=1735272 RepID=UPI001B88797C|nr:uncharacterized protein LOC121372361 isoform X2 [Gigantopelta aegis]XP_041354599.1 uncharacterized protein LOC121372361 isoform X3 [Gigantopelta aegis]